MTDLATLDGIAQAELVRRGELTALELVDAAIDRIERLDPTLNAVVTRTFEAARERAAAPMPDGPLAGVPFLLKDLGAPMAGVRQTDGSRALRDAIAPADSAFVGRCRAAGLVLLGKTNTPEFGNHSTTEPVLFGPTRNPWDLTRTVGGSSGGAGAAAASGMVPAAHGSDGAGSVRIPASCCGVFGLKPTRGRISAAPGGEPMMGLSTSGVLSRSVRDNAALLDATCGPVPGDPHASPTREGPFLLEVGRDPGRLRIAWTARPPLDVPVDPACVDAVRATAALLEELGHDVEEAAPEIDPEVILGTMGRVWAVSNAQDHRRIVALLGRELRADELEETTWELVEDGRSPSAVDLLDDVDEFNAATRRLAPFFRTYSAWLTPTLAREPPALGVLNRSWGGGLRWWRMDCAFNPWNPVANLAGLPSMSLPLHWSPAGLPVGSLITGRFGDEATLFRLAGQLEAARPWAARRPAIWAGEDRPGPG
jgi:amidase